MTREANTIMMWQGQRVRIIDPDYQNGALVQLEGDTDGPILLADGGDLTPIPPPRISPDRRTLLLVPVDEWSALVKRHERARTLRDEGATSEAVKRAAADLGISPRTVYRDIERLKIADRPSVLIPRKAGRPSGLRLLDPRVDVVIDKAFQNIYLAKNRPKLAQVVEEIRAECRRLELVAPSTRTIGRRLEDLDYKEVLRRRWGSKAARYKIKPLVGHVQASLPLEQMQIDHTRADLMLVTDDDQRVELGRPWITLAIDVYTRVICGFYISFDAPSSLSTALCLTHALLPKDAWLSEMGLSLVWPFFGKPKLIFTDNGSDFHALALRRGCAEQSIELSYRPVGSPHTGGHIERLMGTVAGVLTLVPGATQRDSRELGDKTSRTTPVMTLPEFRRWFTNELAIYHRRLHRGLNCAPLQKWNDAVQAGFVAPRLPDSWERLDVLVNFLPFEKRLVRRTGVQLWDLHYWAPGLKDWVGDGEQREVFYDPRDISVVYMRAPTGFVVELKVTDSTLPRCSLAEWRTQRSLGRKRAQEQELVGDRDKALKDRRELINHSIAATKSARLAKGKRNSESVEASAKPDVQQSALPLDAGQPAVRYHTENWS